MADKLAGAAVNWFKRFRKKDDLSRLVKATAATSVDLSDAEFKALRKLLEQEQTWRLLAGGKLNEKAQELTERIAECLPSRDDRTAEDARAAAAVIARGLLEFAVFDLQPEIFQKVVLARLQQMSDQASALDQALFRIHGDLYHLVDDARDLFKLVSDRLPPRPADLSEIRIYLKALTGWLNSDPWPEDRRLGGPVLTQATIERKLRVSVSGASHEPEIDADELARRCIRLVILGGPGSGKTWLAKRSARLCAETALDALAAGAGLDEVELPLYTTCARLSAALPSEWIRRAVVSSALGQLPDLGGSRIVAALRVLFEERSAPTLLVADSLDEARDPDGRIRQADTLLAPWRIVLTSRPGSWDRQLAISDNDPSRRTGTLLPLRYPEDVEPFIACWFSGRPSWAADLTAQIRGRPELQQAATVPLILAFYCIIGGDRALPSRRADLYAKVIRRMLTGRWRGTGDRAPDPDACLDTLRDWAWSAAATDPVSGTGAWVDEFPTPRARQHSRDDLDAMDHVAVAQGSADADSGMTLRRFVHRSIRERLVAEHIALRMPASEAAGELLKHLWYDPDWEIAAPAALAMHPQRDQVLKDLISRVTSGDQRYAGLAAIDGCQEIRRFLTRVAQESSEDAWSPKSVEIIGQARQDIAASGPAGPQQVATRDWPTSNRPILQSVLQLLADVDPEQARELAGGVAGLTPTEADWTQARQTVHQALIAEADLWRAWALAGAVVRLEPTEADWTQVRQALLHLLPGANPWQARSLARPVVGLGPTEADRAQARQALLHALAAEADTWRASLLAEAVAGLAVTEAEKAQVRQALLAGANPEQAGVLARVVAGLAVTEADRAQVRHELIQLLRRAGPWDVWQISESVAGLAVSEAERVQVRGTLLQALADANPWQAGVLASAVAGLAVTEAEKAQVRQPLLQALADANPWQAWTFAESVAGLAVTEAEKAQVRQLLLQALADANAWRPGVLARAVARLAVTEADRVQARQTLFQALAAEADTSETRWLAEAATALAVSETEKAQVRQALLQALDGANPKQAPELAEAVARLEPTKAEKAQARQTLLQALAAEDDSWQTGRLAEAATALAVSETEKAQVRQALLQALDGANPSQTQQLAEAVARLEPTETDRAQLRQALLQRLARADPWKARWLAEAVAGLEPTETEKAQVRQPLLQALATEANPSQARELAEAVARLSVTAADLDGSYSWPLPPNAVLLAAARRNSELLVWLATLPRLSGIARTEN